MMEKNYDFRKRHFAVHKAGRRNPERLAQANEVLIDASWKIGCDRDAPEIVRRATVDLQDYFAQSMGLSLKLVHAPGSRVLFIRLVEQLPDGDFAFQVSADAICFELAQARHAFTAVVHAEDIMSLEGAPVLPLGRTARRKMLESRSVHSGSGIDDFPDEELVAMIHAGYDCVVIFSQGFDMTRVGPRDFNDIIARAKNFGIGVFFLNYMSAYVHPDDPEADKIIDSLFGEFFRRYPDAEGIALCGESLEFPSKDPHTTGRRHRDSYNDGVLDPRPSPGWYPCYDYPAYLAKIRDAVHAANPKATIQFSTYNWGYQPNELRREFLKNFPRDIYLSTIYDIFASKTLEGLQTPIMDYTLSVVEPSYFFTSECENASLYDIPIAANVNTAGISWSFGTVPYVPVPDHILKRNLHLRQAKQKWNVCRHYCTHHYGYWNCLASDLGKWSTWDNYEPDYDELLLKIAIRDYGKAVAGNALKAWKFWDEAMNYYIASNEDQYGPWRVGPSYPFIFQPDITRTMQSKEIKFPTTPGAHFGHSIIKTLYHPFENANQSPGFLRHPAEIRSLEKMLLLWNQGLAEAGKLTGTEEGQRMEALGRFIRNSIVTTINIKKFYRLNINLLHSQSRDEALGYLAEMELLLAAEADNTRDTIPAVETDSRIGWEPSMEYVCDRWHLEWKLRQLATALEEIAIYRKIVNL